MHRKIAILIIAFAFTQAAAAGESGKVSVAMLSEKGAPVYAGEIFSAGKSPVKIVDKFNAQIELAPYSVVEFSESAEMKLLRGSALVESQGERTLRTSTAMVDFAGKLLVSYDHKQKSSSAFVLEGEARMANPSQGEHSLRLGRLGGATLEVGGVLPQLIRRMDFASVANWMKGYAWPEEQRARVLSGLPRTFTPERESHPSHLEEAKIEDYFSAIETAENDLDQPDYYEKKFADPDVVMAEANSKQATSSKTLKPEEAALITLPSTKIDLGFEVLSADERAQETRRLGRKDPPKAASRAPASVKPKVAQAETRMFPAGMDPEVGAVLERLRGIEPKQPVVSGSGGMNSRAPASTSMGSSLVPDPVYDYSENF